MPAAVDHLVVAAADLDTGAAWLEARLGVPLTPGGRHASMGTHNRLLRLGPRLYLELIAIDPAAPPPGRARWFGLDEPAMRRRLARQPRLVHWVARGADVSAAARAGAEPLGEILELARGDYRWRITVHADGSLPGNGLVPSVIEWASRAHPADTLPERGCALMKLQGFHAEPERIRAALAALGLANAMSVHAADEGADARLVACLRTPAGLRELE